MALRTGVLASLAVLALVSVGRADIISNLALYLDFENAGNLAKDNSSYNHAGSVVGGTTQVAGKFGFGAAFNPAGGDDRIEITATKAGTPELYGTSVTAAGWFKTTVSPGTTHLSVLRHESHYTPFQMAAGGNSQAAVFNNGSFINGDAYSWNSGAWSDDQWHFYVAEYAWDAGSSTARDYVFIDGKKIIDVGHAFPVSAGAAADKNWAFGGRETSSGGDEQWTGTLDDVRVYNRALSFTLDGNNVINGGDLLELWQTPEPATLSLLALGGVAALVRRKRK
jgi:hypothetical protein